jgi:hypothetical protein
MDDNEKKEILFASLRQKIKEYDLPETCEKIPTSGQYVEIKYNDGTKDVIDPVSEFYLCKKYFVYFADKYGYILDVKEKRIYAFKAHPFQKNLIIPALVNRRFVIFRKARQVGISVICGIFAVWKTNFNIAQDILIISRTRKDAQDFKEKAMVTYERLPAFLKTKPTRDGQNMTTLKLVNNSRIEVRSAAADSGRGVTASLLIMDEAAFMQYADEIWASAFPSLSNSNGQCFLISTSNGVGNFYHKMWVDADNGDNDFYPVHVPWWKFPGRDNSWLENIENHEVAFLEKELGPDAILEIKKDVPEGREDLYWNKLVEAFSRKKEDEALNYEGIRENKPWLKQQKDNLSIRRFHQEVLSRFLGSGNTVVGLNALERIEQQLKEPIFSDSFNGSETIKGLLVFQVPINDITYTMTVDVSSGSGKDYNTFQLFRDDTLEQVAEYKQMVDTKQFGIIIRKIAKHFNYAYVIIETNQGMSVFNEVFLDKDEPYQNVFYEFKNKAYRGLHTGPANKKLMLDEFMTTIENNDIKIYGKRTLEELQVYIWHNDKPQASRGYNDDLVLPIMFLAYMIKYGNQKTKVLGFATATQTVGMTQDEAKEAEEERKYEQEETAKEEVQKAFGMDWESYAELVK